MVTQKKIGVKKASTISNIFTYVILFALAYIILFPIVYSVAASFKPMSEIFGDELPSGTTADGYGIKLSECGAYSLDAFRSLPRDSIICIMRPFVMSGNSNSEKYEKTIEYFKSIVEFGKE